MGGAGCGDVGVRLVVEDTVPVHGLTPPLTLPCEGGGDTGTGAQHRPPILQQITAYAACASVSIAARSARRLRI